MVPIVVQLASAVASNRPDIMPASIRGALLVEVWLVEALLVQIWRVEDIGRLIGTVFLGGRVGF
ncbi:hypothetical protein GCM10027432_03410 [Lysobacter fragariae]